jgi:2-hydroxycyclohexanecarboxyl-CoA dehydrogenase
MAFRGLQDQVAVVTGGGSGIGRAISLRLAEEGCRVAVFDLNAAGAEESVRLAADAGGTSAAFAVDITDHDAVLAAVERVENDIGGIGILVNNAGWDRMEMFLDSEEETWDKIIAINFKGILYVCKAALPSMVARGQGKVISIASDAGRAGSTGEAVYAGTKGAIIAFSKTLAREMARHKITVNVVCPGLTETPLLQGIREQSPKTEKVIEAVTRAIPLGRVGQPEDIAGAVVYLASPAADFVTGQTLSVSGGLTMV